MMNLYIVEYHIELGVIKYKHLLNSNNFSMIDIFLRKEVNYSPWDVVMDKHQFVSNGGTILKKGTIINHYLIDLNHNHNDPNLVHEFGYISRDIKFNMVLNEQ